MSRRQDDPLREVVVGRYTYRHEAEFAAGFLSEAGIPHRLQIDDPSLGMALSSATIRVLEADAERATEVLRGDPLAEGTAETDAEAHGSRDTFRPPVTQPLRPAAARAGRPPMTVRERLVGVLLGAGVWGLGGFVPAGVVAASWLMGALAAALVLCSLVGWAPGPIRGLVATLAGEAH